MLAGITAVWTQEKGSKRNLRPVEEKWQRECRGGHGQLVHLLGCFIMMIIPGFLEAPNLKEATEKVR